ncbi:hypothetical protein [Sodalis-like endosymbiont of Proechinophthirus fluctus]|uniref:hypothetical protein n=1 Tax=Sodalis-like endosymbiont of Proechinophthirus fluctus TaxID=1462730 RepID=UPI000B18293F|nr:hypothetical protein [Sodalis-like endosymbiont of Proechinophthirus fluctus]
MLSAIASSVAETWRRILRGETTPDAGKIDLGKPDNSKRPTQAKLTSLNWRPTTRATFASLSGKGASTGCC